jgi:hypothetical protein
LPRDLELVRRVEFAATFDAAPRVDDVVVVGEPLGEDFEVVGVEKVVVVETEQPGRVGEFGEHVQRRRGAAMFGVDAGDVVCPAGLRAE